MGLWGAKRFRAVNRLAELNLEPYAGNPLVLQTDHPIGSDRSGDPAAVHLRDPSR